MAGGRKTKGIGAASFIQAQYEAMKADVRDMIRIFGSEGRAGHAAGKA